jgi:hypothetical protein
LSCMVILLVGENGQHAPNARPLGHESASAI